MFKNIISKLFGIGIKYGLATAEKDVRFQAFKEAYNLLGMDEVLEEMVKDSDNKLTKSAVKALNSVLKEED